MTASTARSALQRLRASLVDLDPDATPVEGLRHLIRHRFDELPMPASGDTLQRWQALAAVAEHDLSLAKLFEGHTDALAIMAELGTGIEQGSGSWGTWAAEAPGGRTLVELDTAGRVIVSGKKFWCSGAADLDHGLLTAWYMDGRGPQLVRVAMNQRGISVDRTAWHAVGMRGSASLDIELGGVVGQLVGGVGDYLSRPGFWQGGAGVAACWYGGARSLGTALLNAVVGASSPNPARLAALGKVDLSLRSTAALLREAAWWIDEHPHADASATALRARLAAEACARLVLDEAGRALGAGAFCRDAHFARMAADLPVFVRQSHGDRDFAGLAERTAELEAEALWTL